MSDKIEINGLEHLEARVLCALFHISSNTNMVRKKAIKAELASDQTQATPSKQAIDETVNSLFKKGFVSVAKHTERMFGKGEKVFCLAPEVRQELSQTPP